MDEATSVTNLDAIVFGVTTMNKRIARSLAIVAVGGIAATNALAQNYGSFNSLDSIHGVGVTYTGLDYTIKIDPGAYLVVNNTQYDITDAFGFWTLSASGPLNGLGSTQQNWNWKGSTAGGGEIAGWSNNSKSNAITPGNQMTLSYAGLSQNNVDDYGFHFSLAQNFNGSNTAYFKGSGSFNPNTGVPEPASIACLGVGALALLRRRRSKSR